jgi:hypothetical protein
MRTIEVGVPVRSDDEQASRSGTPQDVTQHEQCRLRCPMHVIEYEQKAGVGGRGTQPRIDGFE